MEQQGRREFLKRSLAAAGVVGGVSLRRQAAAAVAAKPAPASAAQDAVQLSIARWKEPSNTADEAVRQMAVRLTEQAMDGLGGMKRFVNKGDVVWIKPNIGFVRPPQFAANTNPDVVATLVRLCFDAGAKAVRVGDNSCYGADGAYPTSGIEAAGEAVGGEVVRLSPDRFKMMAVEGERIRQWPVSVDMVESDLVINVPVAKTHAMTRVSLCFKNYMGVIGGPRHEWHTDMPVCLTDITAFMKPRLSVLDAVRTLVRGGPIGMSPSDAELTGMVAASTDVVGLESFGAEHLGCDPNQGRTMAMAERRGLGHIDYRKLVRREEVVS